MSEFLKLTGLALADAVNPCAIAVLTMILISILVHNPDKRKKVLYAGLAFSAAIFAGYFVYGVIINQFFKVFDIFLRENSIMVQSTLAILAMVLGALNVKDYVHYKKGSFATEMPLFMRPKVKKIIQKVTSVKGAFITGFVITLFLLPCTMGPYIIAMGIISKLNFFQVAIWLLYYNLLFILPMLIITLIVHFGFTKVEEVSGWKEKHIKQLHLIAGILLFLVGFSILMGWL